MAFSSTVPATAPEASTSADDLVIQATYQPRSGELFLESSTRCAVPGSVVTWLFFGVPDDYQPKISFRDPLTGGNLGPFEELVHAPTKVHGTTKRDATGSHDYEINLEPAKGHSGGEPPPTEGKGKKSDICFLGPDDPEDPRKPVGTP